MRTARTQTAYESQLRKVARIIGVLTDTTPADLLSEALRHYAELLEPWATRTARRMLKEVDSSSLRMWSSLSEEISFRLRNELAGAPVGSRFDELLAEQVEGIKSIPLRAAERVEALAQEALVSGGRATEIAELIARTGEVSKSDAVRLARTSVSGAATALVQSRAEYAGSVAYVWETSRDGTVRPSHRAMQGAVVRWDSPPTIDDYTAHAGQFANCRCWPRPILELE